MRTRQSGPEFDQSLLQQSVGVAVAVADIDIVLVLRRPWLHITAVITGYAVMTLRNRVADSNVVTIIVIHKLVCLCNPSTRVNVLLSRYWLCYNSTAVTRRFCTTVGLVPTMKMTQ